VTTSRLHEAGLRTPATIVCQGVEAAMEAFDALGRDCVLKPVFGGEGRGLVRITDVDLAWRAARQLEQQQAVQYWQRFIDHPGHDLRVFVLGDEVLGMRRRHESDWRTNLARGAVAEPLAVDEELATLARRAAACVGAPVAGVDFLPDKAGKLYVIEVNAVPGWRGLAAATGIDVARRVLDFALEPGTAGDG
jgi:ribosomal protein S6--L-glutamate ligase